MSHYKTKKSHSKKPQKIQTLMKKMGPHQNPTSGSTPKALKLQLSEKVPMMLGMLLLLKLLSL
jgi:hypothetical protein